MALKPAIFKLQISLSDLNRNYYDTLGLTIAQHPSETIERMFALVLAFCINAQEHLVLPVGLVRQMNTYMGAYVMVSGDPVYID